jgi:hypothetical protein
LLAHPLRSFFFVDAVLQCAFSRQMQHNRATFKHALAEANRLSSRQERAERRISKQKSIRIKTGASQHHLAREWLTSRMPSLFSSLTNRFSCGQECTKGSV